MLGEALALPAYSPHAVHAAERHWPQSNCSLDLWITYLNHLGLAPEALMGALPHSDDSDASASKNRPRQPNRQDVARRPHGTAGNER